MKRQLPIVAILCLIMLGASWSLLHPGLFRVHDFVHAARVAEMARGLVDGQIPVRWSANFGYGYGMPLFEFYAPLPYFFGAILWLARVPIELVIKILFFIPTVLTVLAAYRLSRSWLSQPASLLATAAITLAPYRAVNLFVRGALAEAWGMAFVLVSLLGVTAVIQRKRYGALILITGLSGLMLSHNLTTMLTAPLIAVWLVFGGLIQLFQRRTTTKSLLSNAFTLYKSFLPTILGSGVLAMGLTAFYWLPALTEKQFTQMDTTILSGYFDYSLHFLSARQFLQPAWGYGGSNWGPIDGISFFLGYGQLIGVVLTVFSLAIGLMVRLIRRKLPYLHAKNDLFLLASGSSVVILFSAFFAIQRSAPFWSFLPFLHVLQFPWRFLSVLTPLMGLCAAIWFDVMRINKRISLLLFVFLCVVLALNAQYFQPESYLANKDELYYTDAEKIRSDMSEILPDFIPRGFSLTYPPTTLLECETTSACTDLRVHSTRTSSFGVELLVKEQTNVLLATAAYPGWLIAIDGHTESADMSADGRLAVKLDPGQHTIIWRLVGTPIRNVADVITGLTVLVGLYLIGKAAVSKPNPH